LNKDLPDRPLSARANRLIRKIEFLHNYGGKTPERQEEKDDQSIDEDDLSPDEPKTKNKSKFIYEND
jgi:hypothetical protein